jgi:hypothetical protein
MKKLVLILALVVSFISCNTTSKTTNSTKETVQKSQDTVRIANDSIEYEIIIFEPGFNSWLETRAKPEGYYTQSYLESRNQMFVTEWNIRVNQPSRYSPNLYEMRINYSPHIDYGYEVNYKLYNYFIFFQLHYRQQLSSFIPRI